MNNKFYKKYIKYKNKYLQQLGAGKEQNLVFNPDTKLIEANDLAIGNPQTVTKYDNTIQNMLSMVDKSSALQFSYNKETKHFEVISDVYPNMALSLVSLIDTSGNKYNICQLWKNIPALIRQKFEFDKEKIYNIDSKGNIFVLKLFIPNHLLFTQIPISDKSDIDVPTVPVSDIDVPTVPVSNIGIVNISSALHDYCYKEYKKFKQQYILSEYIYEIYKMIQPKLKDISHQIYGEYNLMKIFNINDIVEIAEIYKNNSNLCEVFSLLYTMDINIFCESQKDLINFIKVLSKIFHNDDLKDIPDNIDSNNFNRLFNEIKLTNSLNLNEIKLTNTLNLDESYYFLANYIKSIITTQQNEYNDDIKCYFTIKNNFSTDNKQMFKPGEIMFFCIDFINTNTNKIYHYKIFDIHIATSLQLHVYNHIDQNSSEPLKKFFMEYQLCIYDIFTNIYNVFSNISDKDKNIVELLLNINLSTKHFNSKNSLDTLDISELNLKKLYGDDLINRQHLINLILEKDSKIIFKIQKLLLCLNMFVHKFINNLIFINDDIILKQPVFKEKIVNFYIYTIRLAIFLGINIIYINSDKKIETFNSAVNKTDFMTKIKNLITISNIDTIFQTIIDDNKRLRIKDYNHQIKILRDEVLYSKLYTDLNSHFYIRDLTEPNKSKLFNEYYQELKLLDKSNQTIKKYCHYYYITLNKYIYQEIYSPNKIKNIDYERDINTIYQISTDLSEVFNTDLFKITNSSYIYVFRTENFLVFEDANTYLTIPINSEFTTPYPMSTGIEKPLADTNKNILLRIRLKEDDKFIIILTYSTISSEKEILLPPGTIFKLIQRQIIKESSSKDIQYLIDLEIVGNSYTNFKDFIYFYKNTYVSNQLYFRLIQDKALICNIPIVNKYITKLYEAYYSKTVPLLFEDPIINIQKIIKGYLFRKNINKTFTDYNDETHPLNIEMKLLELTSNLLNLELPPTPHLINSYGKINNCSLDYFVKYVKEKICSRTNQNWICDAPINNSDYFNEMKFISIEYAEEGTFRTLLESGKIDTAEKLYQVFFQIFYTLSILYDYYGFVHFDLKPDNILFCKDKNYKSTDQKYYKYIYNDQIYYIPIREYIVKIANYDASFYNGINNPLIIGDRYHMSKVRNIIYGKVDIYLIFNLLNENQDCLDIINKIMDGDKPNYISLLAKHFRTTTSKDIDDTKVPLINQVLITKSILDISIFNFPEITDSSLIHTKYTHNSTKIYENLMISPQEHDHQVKQDALQKSLKFRLDSEKKLNRLRNNSHTLRIMTYNVHEWTDSSNIENVDRILNDILLVFPDILCLQEDKSSLTDSTKSRYIDIQSDIVNLFNRFYMRIIFCNADNGLINSIFIKKIIRDNVHIIDSSFENIGKDTKESDAHKRCMSYIKYIFKDGRTINIFNLHLHYYNVNNDASINFSNALESIMKKTGDKIVLGDFNSYCNYDYPNRTINGRNILQDFIESKKTMPRVDITDQVHKESLFSICKFIEDNPSFNLIDMYESYLDGRANFFKDDKSYIPLNTNRYGGRIDLMFWNTDNTQKLLGMYKLYSEESDHSPIICDLYDPLPRFDPTIEKTMTFQDYTNRNIIIGNNMVDYSLNSILNNKESFEYTSITGITSIYTK
jgi:endonuclease/exonuclease/phosphatase family metal-dependent hydrolase